MAKAAVFGSFLWNSCKTFSASAYVSIPSIDKLYLSNNGLLKVNTCCAKTLAFTGKAYNFPLTRLPLIYASSKESYASFPYLGANSVKSANAPFCAFDT